MKTKGQGHVQSRDRRNQHLDLRPLDSRAARKQISIVEASIRLQHLLQRPWEAFLLVLGQCSHIPTSRSLHLLFSLPRF